MENIFFRYGFLCGRGRSAMFLAERECGGGSSPAPCSGNTELIYTPHTYVRK
jgi:hypothetical protein